MDIINFFLINNFFFKFYLCMILLLNTFVFYKFIFEIFYNNKMNNKNNNIENLDEKKYCLMYKKLVKISKNPIIFEYQLEQIKKISINSIKFIEYKDYIKTINVNKNLLLLKYHKQIDKILIDKKYEKKNINDIIIKLFCINF